MKTSRYSKAAVRSVEHANQLAVRFNHEHLGSEHLLGGLLAEESGSAAALLRSLGVDPLRIRELLLKSLVPNADIVTGSKLARTACFNGAIERAVAEAASLGHAEVDTRHLLIGLVRGNGLVADLLRQNGVSADGLRGRSAGPKQTNRIAGERGPAGNGVVSRGG